MIDDLLAANESYAAKAGLGAVPPQPAKQLAVLTCMDSRIEPWAVFGLARGEAHVLRNAGGRVTDDAIRSLAVSVHVFGVRLIAVVGHTGCGLAAQTNAELISAVQESAGVQLPPDYDFLATDSIETAVRSDASRLASHPLFAGVEVAGLVFDIATGRLRRVA